ncbi:MAG: hypothetical protein KJ622_15275 [Alphaproteobacteria bacterium]|nr:hypothetical protein [Alphaproteobacteria bacterium]
MPSENSPTPCNFWYLPAIASAMFAIAAALPAHAGPAIGQFELKDLEAEPGNLEFQSQNAHSWSQPRRKSARDEDGEPIFDDNSVVRQRHALEMEATLSTFLRMRVGIEYEKERLDEVDDIRFGDSFGDLKLDEVAVEVVTIFKRVPESGGIGFGALAEFEHPLEAGELNSIVLGPIVEAKFGPWGAVGNLTFVHHFGNGERGGPEPERDQKWDLAYATQLSYTLNDNWMFALEGYGTFDRIGNSGTPGEERAAFGDHHLHRAGPLVYYSWKPGGHAIGAARGLKDGDSDEAEHGEAEADDDDEMVVTLGVGMLFGLNDNTPDNTLKWSLEVEF